MPHADILDRADSLNKPLLGSVALHAAVFGTLVLWGVVLSGPHDTWGEASSGGPGSIAINVVNKIPLPSRSGIVNPLANDTESAVPTPPPAANPHQEPQSTEAVRCGPVGGEQLARQAAGPSQPAL
jgi:hypothetical protein